MATRVESKETTALIGSDKVDGTSVYGGDGKKIGSIERVSSAAKWRSPYSVSVAS